MKRAYALLLAAVLACLAFAADASFEQSSEELQKKQRLIDSDRQVQEPLLQTLDANCNVNNALKAGLTGDPKGFADSLDAAQKKLRAVAERLPKIAEKGHFKQFVKKGGIPVLQLRSGEVLPIRNGDELLKAIAVLAQQSADAIERIRTGKGGDEDFSLIANNSAIIPQLVLEFYNLQAA
jgi:hypothetical protein